MNELNIRLPPKIGDILYDKAHLDLVHHLYDVVNLAIQLDMFCWRSRDENSLISPEDHDAYLKFISELMKWLFSEKNYVVNMARTIAPQAHGLDWNSPRTRSQASQAELEVVSEAIRDESSRRLHSSHDQVGVVRH